MNYQECREAVASLKEQIRAAFQQFFQEKFQEFFADHPDVDSIGWTQYTPYFNDGDVCEFGVHASAYNIEINGVSGSEVPIGVEYKYGGNSEPYRQASQLALWRHRDAEELLNSFDEGDMKELGDHIKVTVKRDGTQKIEDYEHD